MRAKLNIGITAYFFCQLTSYIWSCPQLYDLQKTYREIGWHPALQEGILCLFNQNNRDGELLEFAGNVYYWENEFEKSMEFTSRLIDLQNNAESTPPYWNRENLIRYSKRFARTRLSAQSQKIWTN